MEPYWKPMTHGDVEGVRRELDAHLAHTPKAGEAMLIADRLHALVDRHEELVGEQCSVVCAAVAYFLEVDDAWKDTRRRRPVRRPAGGAGGGAGARTNESELAQSRALASGGTSTEFSCSTSIGMTSSAR